MQLLRQLPVKETFFGLPPSVAIIVVAAALLVVILAIVSMK